MKKLYFLVIFILFVSTANSTTYYLNANAVDDSGTGEQSSPWKTLAKAQSVALSGDVVILSSGDYGAYIEANEDRADWVTYRAANGASVHFDYIFVNNTSLRDTYLEFSGISIKPDIGNTICSPQDETITTSSCTKTQNPVELLYANKVKIVDSDLEGADKYLTPTGVRLYYTNNIEITHNQVHETTRGIQIEHAANTLISRNHIHRTVASGINQGSGGDTGTIIQYNHIHDSHYNSSDDYCVRPNPQDAYHGSGVALRSSDVTIIGNIIHDGYPSGGIYTYTDTSHYDNIIINGNLLYDLSTNVIIQLLYIGDNCEVKNNTLMGYYYTSSGINRLTIGLLLYSVDTDGSPSIDVYNNVVGARMGVATAAMSILNEDNNIFYSYQDGIAIRCNGDSEIGANSIVKTCTSSEPVEYFTNGTLFNGNINISQGHGSTQDFRLALGSDAINFGSSLHQITSSIGSIDTDGFIVDNGPSRSVTMHSAGAYEYGATATHKHLRIKVDGKFLRVEQ